MHPGTTRPAAVARAVAPPGAIICLLAFGLFALASGFLVVPVQAQSTNTTDIPYIGESDPPAVDGIREEVYDMTTELQMLEVRAGPDPMPEEDLAGSCWPVHDDEFLYVFVDITDDELLAEEATAATDGWNDDSVELYIDGDNSKTPNAYDGVDDAQLRFRIGDDVASGGDGWIGGSAGTEPDGPLGQGIEWTTLAREDGSGYAIEVMIPLANFGIPPADGYLIGFDCHVNDDDDGDGRDGKVHWGNAEGDNQWQWANMFPTATLVGGSPLEGATARLTRDPASGIFVGDEVTFDATTSSGGAGAEITAYDWDFGDGNTGTGVTVIHVYEEAGTYTVTLTVTDSNGSSSEASTTVPVLSLEGTLEQPLQIPMAPSAPEIDAVLDEAYADAQVAGISRRANGQDPDDENDLSGAAHVMWDAERLYVFFDVTDEALFNDSGSAWQDDTPEIYVDGQNDKTVRGDAETGYDDNDMQLEVGYNTAAPSGVGPVADVVMATAAKDDETGYYVEVSVPWANIGLEPAVGHVIGFELMINDDDEGGDVRQTKLAWFASAIDEAYRDPSVFGNAILVEEITTSIDDPSELPGAFAIESVYPNPFNPSTNALLSVQQPGEYTVRVFNVLGQLVHEQQLQVQAVGQVTVSLEMNDQASGVYLLSVQNQATGKTVSSKAMLVK